MLKLISTFLLLLTCTTFGENAKRPNVLWLFVEDLSPLFGCYGDEINQGHTEALDALAGQGILFKRAYVPAPVCSATRSAMIVGVHQITTGTHQHRSSRAPRGVVPEELRIYLPEEMKTIPELMRKAGYFTFNQGKDDYNFHYNREELYDIGSAKDYKNGVNGWQGNKAENFKDYNANSWASRPDKSQPWFGQLTLWGGKGDRRYLPKEGVLKSDEITLPPYFPDTKIQRGNWANHYNQVRGHSHLIKKVIDQLKEDGELENTIIFYFSDHGNNQSLRHKQLCYEGGLHVPMMVVGDHPKIKAGSVVNTLTSTLDIPATTLALADIALPEYLDGQDLFSDSYKPLEYVASARDRCDFTIDKIRTIRTDKYRYIKNYYPDRPLMQPQYRDTRASSIDLRAEYKAERLTAYQAEHWFGVRPVEELYDIAADPHQINNLATNPQYSETLIKHREILESWRLEVGDNDEVEDPIQLKAVYELWKNKAGFKGAETNSEYDQFR